ncbi:MAG: iron chelate uptake ABC transporter family permease subunit, partial [Rhizobium pusense]|nr:iron chelate uptake ABC transporter family permease subunit [Agrobacterium pusense]
HVVLDQHAAERRLPRHDLVADGRRADAEVDADEPELHHPPALAQGEQDLPRVLVAVFAGASLGVSGAVFQSVSRNPLGSPDVIGFTTGAATGALAQIVIFGGGPLAVALSAVLGGLVTATLVYLLSFKQGVTGGYRLVLTGIGAGATLNALNGLMLVKGSLDNAIAANLWLAGSLDARNWDHALTVVAGAL